MCVCVDARACGVHVLTQHARLQGTRTRSASARRLVNCGRNHVPCLACARADEACAAPRSGRRSMTSARSSSRSLGPRSQIKAKSVPSWYCLYGAGGFARLISQCC
eukprot:222292-Rhodomonas_salina.2